MQQLGVALNGGGRVDVIDDGQRLVSGFEAGVFGDLAHDVRQLQRLGLQVLHVVLKARQFQHLCDHALQPIAFAFDAGERVFQIVRGLLAQNPQSHLQPGER